MAVTDHYDFRYIDPDEEISEFPGFWNYEIDKIDDAIHDASANDDVAASRITGTLAISRIPNLNASKINSGRFPEARMPQDILDRLDKLEKATRTTGKRDISDLMDNAKSGTIKVHRTGNLVELSIYGLEPDGPVGMGNVKVFEIGSYPKGFRPPASAVFPVSTTNVPDDPDLFPRTYIDAGGRFEVSNPGELVYGNIMYHTNEDWPSTLPGDPA